MTTFADSYDLVQSASVAESGYDDDLLLANWNRTEVLARCVARGGNPEASGAGCIEGT